METLPIRSVADFGCAEGVWLAAWKSAGATDVQGVDGPWVDLARLQIDQGDFLSADLTQPINVGDRQFDLVQSLEVAEHLPASAAVTFVEALPAMERSYCFLRRPRVRVAKTISTSGSIHIGRLFLHNADTECSIFYGQSCWGTPGFKFGIVTTRFFLCMKILLAIFHQMSWQRKFLPTSPFQTFPPPFTGCGKCWCASFRPGPKFGLPV